MTAKAFWLFSLIEISIGHAAPALRLFADPAQPISPVAMAEDADGFVWVAADEGVFRFDGSNFSKIPGNFEVPAGIAVVGGKAVVVAADSGVFEHRDGITTRLSPNPANAFINLTADLVLVLHPLGTGGNWMEAAEWDGTRTKMLPQRERSGWAWLSRDGSLWQRCGRHPCSVQNNGELRTAIRAGELTRYFHSNAEILTTVILPPDPIGQGPQGFIRGANGYYVSRTSFTGLVSVIKPGISSRQFYVGEFTRANGRPGLYVDHLNRVWIPGDYLWISEAGDVRRFLTPQIDGIQVNCVFEDAAGRIWLGLNGRGLAMLEAQPHIESWITPDSIGEINSLIRHGPSVLFATTTKGELLRKRGGGDWEEIKQNMGGPQLSQVASAPASALLGLIRLGPPARLSPDGRILSQFLVEPSVAASSFRRLVAAPDGTFFVGSIQGLYRISGDRLEEIGTSVPHANAQEIVFDEAGKAWVAFDAGVCRVDGGSCLPVITEKDGLLERDVRSLAIGSSDEIWLSYRKPVGFSRFRYSNGQWTARHFTTQGGFENTETQFLRRDRRGWVWRGTSTSGLWISDGVHVEPGDWLQLSERDGLPSSAMHRFGFLEDGDGSVWIGTTRGIARVQPDPAWFSSSQPPRVTAIGTSGRSWIEASQFPGVFEAPTALSLQIGGMSLLPLRYRLRPPDAQWRVSHTGQLHWNQLDPGRYELETVRGSDEAVARYKFEVKRSTGAKTRIAALFGLLIAVLASVAGVIVWRKRRTATLRPLPDLTEARLEVLLPEARLIETDLDNRFALEGVVARGGFSTVFYAGDIRDGGKCAIKIFRQDLGDDWFSRHFLHEVTALETISHPSIVRVYGHGKTPNGSSYLAMEFVEGCTLRHLLDRGPLPLARCAGLLRQIGAALDEIHSHHIYHRDVKPENLMIRNAAAPGKELVLIDFGMAIVKGPDRSLFGLSRAGGTVHYMAPEQALGHASAEGDIYSLGKVVLEMLTSRRTTDLLPEATVDLSERVGEFLRGQPFGLLTASIRLLAASLEFDPARRVHSVGEFTEPIARDLEASAAGGKKDLPVGSALPSPTGDVPGEG